MFRENRLKVHFDGHIFIDQVTGGVSRYYASLATGLNAVSGVEACIISPIHRNEYLAAETAIPVFGVGVPPHWRAGRIAWMAMRAGGPLLSRVMQPDIVHETYFSPKPLLTHARRRVVTVFDMIHELYFPGSLTSQHKRDALARCDHVICISHNTKKDLCELFEFPPERASVTHLAYKNFSDFVDGEAPSTLIESPYFLYVGNRSFYKNFEVLLRAYASSGSLKKNFRIVCFGGGVFTKEENELFVQLGLLPGQIVQMGGNDAQLGAAYANAAAFVYPSLYEGFGIPPLEAMSAGCPVISSNSSSLPEVVGDAALLFDPKEVDALRDAMERLVQSDSLRQTLVHDGHKQRKLFSWENCAKKTLAVYEAIL